MKKSKIDIVIVSYAKDDYLYNTTKNTIASAGHHNIIVVESNKEVSYEGTITIHPNEEFNYNRFLNIGARSCNSEYIFFGNNDLIFEQNWDIELIKSMNESNANSASPIDPESQKDVNIFPNSGTKEGYEIFKHFCGWAFIWTRDLYNKTGGLDEAMTFWCSDNIVVKQLIKMKEKHILATSSIVHHVNKGGTTIALVDSAKYNHFTQDEINKYNELFNENVNVPKRFFPKRKDKNSKKHAIVTILDDNFHKFSRSFLSSIKKNYPNHPEIVILFEGKRENLTYLQNYKNIRVVEMPKDLIPKSKIKNSGYLNTKLIFNKYTFWSDLFEEYDNLLYLDLDCLVLNDLDELINKDEFYIVSDNSNTPKHRVFYPEKSESVLLNNMLKKDGISYPNGRHNMANAGVFLIPKRFRTQKHFNSIIDITVRYDQYLMFADQSAISLWCLKNGINISTDFKYNYQLSFLKSEYFFYKYVLKNKFDYKSISIMHYVWWKPDNKIFSKFNIENKWFNNILDYSYTNCINKLFNELSIIVSIKIESEDRKQNFIKFINFLYNNLKNFELVIVEQDEKSKIQDIIKNKKNIVYQFIQSSDAHYKTRNLNMALSLSTRKYVMMCDCDIIFHPNSIIKSLELLQNHNYIIMPHNGILVEIKKETLKKEIEEGYFPDSIQFIPKNHDKITNFKFDKGIEPLYGNSKFDSSGGAIISLKKLLINIGGWNTNIISYGCEDDEILIRAKKIGIPIKKNKKYNLYHLEHERGHDSFYNSYFRSNENEKERVKQMNPDELLHYAQNGYKEMKYKKQDDIQIINNKNEYSIRKVTSKRKSASNICILISIETNSKNNFSNLNLFLDNLEQTFNDYEVIIIENVQRNFKYLNNKKFVKYIWTQENIDNNHIILLAKNNTKRKYLLIWDFNIHLDEFLLEKVMKYTFSNNNCEIIDCSNISDIDFNEQYHSSSIHQNI